MARARSVRSFKALDGSYGLTSERTLVHDDGLDAQLSAKRRKAAADAADELSPDESRSGRARSSRFEHENSANDVRDDAEQAPYL